MTTPQSIMLVLAFCFIQFQFLFLLGEIKIAEKREHKILDLLEQTHENLNRVLDAWHKIRAAAEKAKEKAN